jgi:hypothetical protein
MDLDLRNGSGGAGKRHSECGICLLCDSEYRAYVERTDGWMDGSRVEILKVNRLRAGEYYSR